LVVDALAYKTGATLAGVQTAVAWTQVALDAPVVEQVPITARVIGHSLTLAENRFLSI
jgi:hypothetical protein